ncbi:MAG: hypothetical protein H6707_07295 [Deltaproteobacteria bacterium]|nr:hypothetical protein [Deltaproteobacteria bacterium]
MSALADYFFELADKTWAARGGDEVLLLRFCGETSDFVRLNNALVRQAGHVEQRYVTLTLIDKMRQISSQLALSTTLSEDLSALTGELLRLRDLLPQLPEDPLLNYNRTPSSTEEQAEDRLGEAPATLSQIIEAAAGRDFVGIFASGAIYNGFANSLGQRNWHESYTFNLDWSVFADARFPDRAIKGSYASDHFDQQKLAAQLAQADRGIELLRRDAKTVSPGSYRAYLAPPAMGELLTVLSWESFGLKAHRTKRTPLLRLASGECSLAPAISLRELGSGTMAPNFDASGFVRPASISLIAQGRYQSHLVSARSAQEFAEPANGANAEEVPLSLALSPGSLAESAILDRLERGIYIGNLWYLNFSDRASCRITGMTRFGTFWVEDGELVAPLATMRFDDSLYRMLGENLVALSETAELLADSESYGMRSLRTIETPGALLGAFELTL